MNTDLAITIAFLVFVLVFTVGRDYVKHKKQFDNERRQR